MDKITLDKKLAPRQCCWSICAAIAYGATSITTEASSVSVPTPQWHAYPDTDLKNCKPVTILDATVAAASGNLRGERSGYISHDARKIARMGIQGKHNCQLWCMQ
ncbi:hypothetical protein [Enterobacter ludwigii]|uniref:hypothetical protein n=1 Tax=Enterobacter ludwigii TaxID=299767 RepID=UPI003F72D937